MTRLSSAELGFEPFDPQLHARDCKLYTLHSDSAERSGFSLMPAAIAYDEAKVSPWQYVVRLSEVPGKDHKEAVPVSDDGDGGVPWLARLTKKVKGAVRGMFGVGAQEPDATDEKKEKWQVQPFHGDWKLKDAPWSFSATDSNAVLNKGSWELYKQVHLVCDTSTGPLPERKSAYKYPVAKLVGGKPAYFWRAVATVNAGISGGARSAGLPDSANQQVAKTLEKIYKAFERDPKSVSVGRKRFVTLEDGRVIFIGGPPQGAGRTSPTTLEDEYQGTPSTSVDAMAAYLRKDAEQFEPELTSLISGFVEGSGGQMYGLGHRLKTEDSIARKIRQDVADDGISSEQAAIKISDVVRYTALFENGDLVGKATELQEKLAEAGWTRYDHKWKNFFASSGAYRGYNTVYTNPEGRRFEFQFHTPESMQIKDAAHKLYERYRVMPRGSERTSLEEQCKALWDDFTPPVDYDRLQGDPMR